MAKYVDGFVVPVAKGKIDAYRRLSRKVAKVWMEHGALEYRECLGEDLRIKGLLGFEKGIGTKRGETVVFGWITYRSRAHRDRVNAKIAADPRMVEMCKDDAMPFDVGRMLYGGFTTIVEE